MIRKFITGGALLYVAILAVQIMQNQTVLAEAIAVGVLLLVVAGLSWTHGSGILKVLKRAEMALLWCAIGLFVVYALLNAGGVI